MANSADPDQLDLDLHCWQRQGISGFSRTRVKQSHILNFFFFVNFCKKTRLDVSCKFSVRYYPLVLPTSTATQAGDTVNIPTVKV